MTLGKHKCKILKEIRRQIAQANDIEFVTSECSYKGNCSGTCPKCESEVQYLEQQLRKRQLAGRIVAIAGISAGTLARMAANATATNILECPVSHTDKSAIHASRDTFMLKGVVVSIDTIPDGSIVKESLIGATVKNLSTGIATSTGSDGNFEIEVSKGDSLIAAYLGHSPVTVEITDTKTLEINLTKQYDLLEITVGMPAGVYNIIDKNYTDLIFTDDNGNTITPDGALITIKVIDEDDTTGSEYIFPDITKDRQALRIHWNHQMALQDSDGNPLKKVKIELSFKDYTDVVKLEIKYPKHHNKKTIKLKNKKL